MNLRPFVIATLALAALPAVAQQAPPDAPASPPSAAAPAADPQPAAKADTPAPDAQPAAPASREVADRHCMRETGTLIRTHSSRTAQGCIPGAAGRAYTQDDLRRTGQTDIATALRMLDPSIR